MLGVEVRITAVLLLTVTGFCVSSRQSFLPALHPLTSWRSMRMERRWSGNLWKPTPPSIILSSARAKVKCGMLPFRLAGNISICVNSSPAGYFIFMQKQPDFRSLV